MDDTAIRGEITRRLLEEFPEAERIVLFGSRATGVNEPDSDYDLLVVADSDLSPAKRTSRARLALRGLPASFDILVITPDEHRRLGAWGSSVVFRASRQGEVLHEAA